MKAFFLTMSILIMTLISCNKTDEIDISSAVVGTWKLTEVLADPGDGSGTFYTVSSNKNLIFEEEEVVTTIFTPGGKTEINKKSNFEDLD